MPAMVTVPFRWIDPPTTAFMLQDRLSALYAGRIGYRIRHSWRSWENITPNAKLAVIASEDQLFAQHSGFDVNSIAQALTDYADGKPLRGASTITQQVAKNLFLWSGRSFARKLLEAYFTLIIEASWPKQRILEVYLNVAEFGPGVYGIGAASAAFFQTSAARLSKSEAAQLAAVLPNPSVLRADHPSPYVYGRRRWIMGQMDRLGGASYLKRLAHNG